MGSWARLTSSSTGAIVAYLLQIRERKTASWNEEEFSTSHSSIWSFTTAVPSPLFRRQKIFSGHGFLGSEEADIAIIIIIICCYYLLQILKQNMGVGRGRISIINFPSSFASSILLIHNCSSIPTFVGSKN
jgi:hypothetical protein